MWQEKMMKSLQPTRSNVSSDGRSICTALLRAMADPIPLLVTIKRTGLAWWSGPARPCHAAAGGRDILLGRCERGLAGTYVYGGNRGERCVPTCVM